MTDVYLEPLAAALPDAADQLRHLAETGHRLYVLGGPPETLADIASIEAAEELPAAPAPGSWFLTADVDRCGERRPNMASMLIGPRPAPSPRPAPRCDADARDLAHAVLEILRREVMG